MLGRSQSSTKANVSLDHCLDMLRQYLMCKSDLTLISSYWINTTWRIKPFPKFATRHQCRNFDDILNWAKEHQMPEELWHHGLSIRPGDLIINDRNDLELP
jgi:hypothetical protein